MPVASPRPRARLIRQAALALATLLVVVSAHAEPPGSVANPRLHDGTWVTDDAGALSPGARARLNETIGKLERDTGAEIAVAIVGSLDDVPVEDYALELFQAWKIGKRGKDNGVLFLWSPGDRRMRFEVGYGLESVLTDGRTGAILDRYVVPAFKRGAFDEGVLGGIDAAVKLIRNEPLALPSPATGSYRRRPSTLPWLLGIALAGAGTVAGWRWRRRRPRRCSECRLRMQRLNEKEDDEYLERVNRIEERIGSVDYDVWKCPGCGHLSVLGYPSWFSRYHRCPQCRHNTCSSTTETLRAATTSHAGRARVTERCEFCRYHDVREHALPRISTSGSSGHGSSASSAGGGGGSSGSFGGGSSGGGGSSRGY